MQDKGFEWIWFVYNKYEHNVMAFGPRLLPRVFVLITMSYMCMLQNVITVSL